MAEVYMIDSSLIAEHAEGMLDRELTAKELELAVEDIRCQLDSNIQSLIETAILSAVRQYHQLMLDEIKQTNPQPRSE